MADTRPRVTVLGSGMAGLGASHRLREEGIQAVVYDRNSHPGGHTASHHMDGYIFDEGPHVSFTKDERIRQYFAESVGGRFQRVDARINNYWRGHWIRHPAITNLHGLPTDLVVECIRDFIDSRQAGQDAPGNYAEWLVATYGRTFAETFPMQYTRKYHTTTAENMSTVWLGPRLYRAALDEVLRGAVSPDSPNVHYVQDYRYPASGGFDAFLQGFLQRTDVRLGHEVVRIDPRARRLVFADGTAAPYDHLISSIPLPDLIERLDGAPPDVREAAGLLACTTLVLVNLGVARPDVSTCSWTYFYEEEYPFSRVSFPRVMSPHTVPEGASGIQAEVYFSRKYRPLTTSPEALIDPVIDGLRRSGLLREDDRITLRRAMLVPWANIIFDLDREPALATVHGYLDDIGIGYCGRYGDWGYLWTDEAFLSGERAAQQLLDGLTSSTGPGPA